MLFTSATPKARTNDCRSIGRGFLHPFGVLVKITKGQALIFLWTTTIALSSCQNSNTRPNQQSSIPTLIYTKHARCRMDCRHINEQEIKDVLQENSINERKSNPAGSPCPTYAYEGYSKENQHLRIVIAKCLENWKVVTCIDLEHEFECDCR